LPQPEISAAMHTAARMFCIVFMVNFGC
jgi:hypothetical protein